MDDWVVLAPTRWKLRAAIRAVNQVMAQLRVRQHPDKTIIGRIARGFDFLGYRFSSAGLAVARQTGGAARRPHAPSFLSLMLRRASSETTCGGGSGGCGRDLGVSTWRHQR